MRTAPRNWARTCASIQKHAERLRTSSRALCATSRDLCAKSSAQRLFSAGLGQSGRPVWLWQRAADCAGQPQERLLGQVLGLGDAAEHPVGDGEPLAPQRLEVRIADLGYVHTPLTPGGRRL